MSRSEWIACGGETALASPPTSPTGFWSGRAERELSLDVAERQIRADVAWLGWSARYRTLDATDPTATQCALWHGDGTEVSYGLGSGKGGGEQARVGAQFEALEHAWSGPLVLDQLPIHLRSSSDLISGPLGLDRALHSITEQTEAGVACLPYTALDGGADLDVPLFLWATWFVSHSEQMTKRRAQLGDHTNYRPARSYSGSTGCAIGATYDEAVLHAVNEWAERDALSLFLLRSVYDGGPMCGRIRPDQLPEALRDQCNRATTLLDAPIVLLDLTTDLAIPVVAAYSPARPGRPASYGMGASLSGTTAVERALTEIVQGELLARVVRDRDGVPKADATDTKINGPMALAEHPTFDDLVAEHDIAAEVRHRLSDYPRLLACAQLDFAARIDESPLTDLPAETVPPGTSVAAQRSAAVERVAAAGHRVVAYELFELPHGTTVVQVQCPGLERFQLITKGHLALPGPRGRRHRAPTGHTD